MHISIKNYKKITSSIETKLKDQNFKKFPVIIAVSKTFGIEAILPLVQYGHSDFGENKVQETLQKWPSIKEKFPNLNLHLIGKLQTNKVKQAVSIFDYIHSLDNKKLALKIAEEEIKQKKKIKLFIQVNIGNEDQKSGIQLSQLNEFYNFCKKINLNILGLMCIPPFEKNPTVYFEQLSIINKKLELKDLSIGMSSDYLVAIDHDATFIRIGSSIFGNRN